MTVVLGQPGGRAAIRDQLDGRGPALVRAWLPDDEDRFEVPEQYMSYLAAGIETLATATEALVLRTRSTRDRMQWFSALVHDGTRAVHVDIDEQSGRALLSEPIAIGEVIAFVAEQIGSRDDDSPPRSVHINPMAFGALQAVLSPPLPVSRSEAEIRLADVLVRMGAPDVSPSSVIAALAADAFIEDTGGQLRSGDAIREHPGLAAAVEGHDITIARMSLSHGSEGPALYDMRSLTFVGPTGDRYALLEGPEPGDPWLIAQLATAELTLLLSSHALARAEPARIAETPWEHAAEPELGVGATGELTADDMRTNRSPALGSALQNAPGTVVVTRDGWDHGRADGMALWNHRLVGWSWGWGAGHYRVDERDNARHMLREMILEHFEEPAGGDITLLATRREGDALELARVRLSQQEGTWSLVEHEGLLGLRSAQPDELAAILLAAALPTADL